MPGFGSLNTATSGLRSAQAGLIVTGHNVSNMSVPGFSRQQTLQSTFRPMNIGYSGRGHLQVGMGGNVQAIRQVRNTFLDTQFRATARRVGFHDVRTDAGFQMQTILGELQGDFTTQRIIEDMRLALNELTLYLPGLDTRGSFISTAVTFVNKMQNIHNRINAYQQNLNEDVISTVHEINRLTTEIAQLNESIAASMASGDRPNDLLDRRNLALDQLSFLVSTETHLRPDGKVDVFTNGLELVVGGHNMRLGLRQTAPGSNFVEPVFTNSTEILPLDAPGRPLFRFFGPIDTDPYSGNDHGRLKSLLATRGDRPITYASAAQVEATRPDPTAFLGGVNDPDYRRALAQFRHDSFMVNHALIPRFLGELDMIFHHIVTMINEATAPVNPPTVDIDDGAGGTITVPNAPYMLSDPTDPTSPLIRNPGYTGPFALDQETQGVEVFSRRNMPRFGIIRTAPGVYEFAHIPEGFMREVPVSEPPIFIPDPNSPPPGFASMYTLGNIILNPIFSTAEGYTMLAFSRSGDIEDASAIFDLLEQWDNNFMGIPNLSVDSAYRRFIIDLANETRDSETELTSTMGALENVDNRRRMASAVSLDEEMTSMMRFQHAYNSAARMLSVIDSMIEVVVNRLGAGRG